MLIRSDIVAALYVLYFATCNVGKLIYRYSKGQTRYHFLHGASSKIHVHNIGSCPKVLRNAKPRWEPTEKNSPTLPYMVLYWSLTHTMHMYLSMDPLIERLMICVYVKGKFIGML
jgi:hypothetical protein